MPGESSNPHVLATETLLRLYVLLAQHLDRSVDESVRQSLSEQDLQAHLASTRSAIADIVAVNPIVKGKVEKECDRLLSLGTAYLQAGKNRDAVLAELRQEQAVLRNKTIALSDLLAVFRAM